MRDTELLFYYPNWIDKNYNFRSFKENPKLLEKIQPIRKNGKIENFQSNEKELAINNYILWEYYHWQEWFDKGKNIFSFTIEILQMLNKTEIGDITYKSLNLPYDNFYISLRPLNLYATSDSDKIIEGVYVSIDRQAMEKTYDAPYDYAISFDFVGDFQELKLKYYDKIWEDSGEGTGGIVFWRYSFYFLEKENIITINDCITETKEIFKQTCFPEIEDEITDYHLDAFNYHIRFIDITSVILVNTLLYLSLPTETQDIVQKYPDDLPHNFNKKLSFAKTKREIEKVETKIKETGYSKIKFVGSSYIRNFEYELKFSEISSHWRRGHWRNQKYGEHFSLTKLVWIIPTIVNKQKGEPEKGHIYTVEN